MTLFLICSCLLTLDYQFSERRAFVSCSLPNQHSYNGTWHIAGAQFKLLLWKLMTEAGYLKTWVDSDGLWDQPWHSCQVLWWRLKTRWAVRLAAQIPRVAWNESSHLSVPQLAQRWNVGNTTHVSLTLMGGKGFTLINNGNIMKRHQTVSCLIRSNQEIP